MDSQIAFEDGSVHSLYVPSGSESGLKLNRGLTVTAGGQSNFTIDFDLRKSVNDPQGKPDFKLRPTLRIVDNIEAGHIAGIVDAALLTEASCADEDPATGNAMYVYEGAAVTPEDVDGGDPEPITSSLITLDSGSGEYKYKAGFLAAGDYTVAFTCQADLDDPEKNDAVQFVQPIALTVTAGKTTTHDFTVP